MNWMTALLLTLLLGSGLGQDRGEPRSLKRRVPQQYATIQAAIDASKAGDFIIVSPGTYRENLQIPGIDITLTSVDPKNPEVVAKTIIDGMRAGSVITLEGTESPDCVIQGFTITNGWAQRGGGIFGSEPYIAGAIAARPTIRNNVITGNYARWAGGGIGSCDGPILDNIVMDNVSGKSGSGIWHSDGLIQGNLITGNKADFQGGGTCGCMGTIENNIIVNNYARKRGAGINLSQFAGVIIRFNTIVGNESGDIGGAMYESRGHIHHNIMWGNIYPNGSFLDDNNVPNYCLTDEVDSRVGTGNFLAVPLFADPARMDYHLLSAGGRWDPLRQSWVMDPVTSPGIDSGNPNLGVGAEPLPHGDIPNVGAYGRTSQASRTP